MPLSQYAEGIGDNRVRCEDGSVVSIDGQVNQGDQGMVEWTDHGWEFILFEAAPKLVEVEVDLQLPLNPPKPAGARRKAQSAPQSKIVQTAPPLTKEEKARAKAEAEAEAEAEQALEDWDTIDDRIAKASAAYSEALQHTKQIADPHSLEWDHAWTRVSSRQGRVLGLCAEKRRLEAKLTELGVL